MNNISPVRARFVEIIAVVGLVFEALALLFAGVAYGIYAASGGVQDVGFVISVGVFCLLLAAGVGLGARGMWKSRRWSRSIALTWQVFQAGLGLAVLGTRPTVGIVLIVVALAVAACVMVRAGADGAIADGATAGSDVSQD